MISFRSLCCVFATKYNLFPSGVPFKMQAPTHFLFTSWIDLYLVSQVDFPSRTTLPSATKGYILLYFTIILSALINKLLFCSKINVDNFYNKNLSLKSWSPDLWFGGVKTFPSPLVSKLNPLKSRKTKQKQINENKQIWIPFKKI